MRTNKCTLLIDGNWLLMSRFSVMGNNFELTQSDLTKQMAQQNLQELMAKSISIILNRFPFIDNVILVTDGGSWRKQLPIPKQLENTTYKGNRVKESTHDWKYIYGALTDLSTRCKELGMTVSNHTMIEGDDWIWYWTRRLNENGVSTVIWSSDNDLKQLIQNDSFNGSITAWYNDRNGVWFDDSLQEKHMDDLDFFMQPLKVKMPILESLKQYSKEASFIIPDSIAMEKIICGDSGDNIKPIARTTGGTRTYKISVKMWNDIKADLGITNIDEFFKNKENIINRILNIKKFSNCDYNDISEMFDYNIKLVWLNESVIPETVIMYMNQLDYNLIDVNYIKSNFKVMCSQENEIEEIFDSIENLPF